MNLLSMDTLSRYGAFGDAFVAWIQPTAVILATAAVLALAASLAPAWFALRSDPISAAGLRE